MAISVDSPLANDELEALRMPRTDVFIVGAPRSGTTFLQNLMGSHPLVASSQETDLFTQYVGPWRTSWEHQLRSDPEAWKRWRHKGLPAVLTEQEFDSIVGGVVDQVHSRTVGLKPGATVCLIKVPQDCRRAELILRYLPNARFIHLIRDGRDVVASQLRAGRGWGREWAPRNLAEAATQWSTDVAAGRSISGRTDAYLELRYEELVSAGGPELLKQALAFTGIEASDTECADTCAAFSLNTGGAARSSMVWGGEVIRRLGAAPAEPGGFAGEGGVGAWEHELDLRARSTFERTAGGLLHELGYTSSPEWVDSRRAARVVASVGATVQSLPVTARYRLRAAVIRRLRIAG
jgi:hypothetical protein